MIRMALREAARVLDGKVLGGDAPFQGLSHDSRGLAPGNLFVALPGMHADGHDFLPAAAAAGAAAALVARPVDHPLPQLHVADVLAALGRLAGHWRRQMTATVIGVTGSNGKTTVKEMLAAMLARVAPVLATQGNYNNEIGLPLTLSRLNDAHRYAVLEMGAARAGDIAYLAGIAAPDVGLVNNAGPAHLAGFGSLEGVARAKGEMFQALGPDGIAIINRDDAHHALWCQLAGERRQISFGFDPEAMVRGEMEAGRLRVTTPAGEFNIGLRLPGRHNAANALAATAAAIALELPPADIVAGLEAVHSLPGRLQRLETASGWVVLDDTYNANPASLYAGITAAAGGAETWLVLGDMAELGEAAEKLHAEMGMMARDLGVSRLFAVGELTRHSVQAFGTGARHFTGRERLVQALRDELAPGVQCLVKGSRSAGMEQVVAALVGGGR